MRAEPHVLPLAKPAPHRASFCSLHKIIIVILSRFPPITSPDLLLLLLPPAPLRRPSPSAPLGLLLLLLLLLLQPCSLLSRLPCPGGADHSSLANVSNASPTRTPLPGALARTDRARGCCTSSGRACCSRRQQPQ